MMRDFIFGLVYFGVLISIFTTLQQVFGFEPNEYVGVSIIMAILIYAGMVYLDHVFNAKNKEEEDETNRS